MAHVTVELHEKYAGEKISDFDHAVVHEEMAAIGCTQDGVISSQSKRVIRGSYIADSVLPQDVDEAHQNIERRLGRRASVMASVGQTYGYGLRPQLASLLRSDSPSASTHWTSLFASPAESLRPLMAAPTNAYSNLTALMGTTPATPSPLTLLTGLKPSKSVWATVPESGPPAATGGLARLILKMGKNS